MARIQSQAAAWTDAIWRFIQQAEGGKMELAAQTHVHAMLLELARGRRRCADGAIPVGLEEALKALSVVQHPVLTLTGVRRQAKELLKLWS
ncbi:hypothetical protein AURDEDRAFT_170929 [Auricularia subglabra TFB-10046 SS5]|nr:hypothetical protein AURDEDRAFT_170929 [Auricularia subglabra TFB-10046 SS5]